MTYDVHFRYAQALDPSGLDSLAACFHAVQAAARDCRNAGLPFETDPAVILLARHLGEVATALMPDRAALHGLCAEALADLARKPVLATLAARGVSHDDVAKRLFHAEARKALRRLADALHLSPADYDLRVCAGEQQIERAQTAETAMLGLEALRETAAQLYMRETGSSWRPAGGSRINHDSKATSAVVQGRDFLKARAETKRRAAMPVGSPVVFAGGRHAFTSNEEAKAFADNVWTTLDKVREHVAEMVLVHGGDSKGVDRLAAAWAERHRIPQIAFGLDSRLGQRAGFRRNEQMLSLNPRYVVAFAGSGVLERLVIDAKERRIAVVDRRGPMGTNPKRHAVQAEAAAAAYERTLTLIDEELGSEPFRLATRPMIKAVRDSYALHPRKAHKIKQMVSRLYSWADENDLVPEDFNPAARIKRLKRKGGEREYVVWSAHEIELFLAGSSVHVRTPVMIALYTGQRANDIARMRWAQWQGDMIRVRQAKTGALLDIACHQRLREHLTELQRSNPGRNSAICLSASGRSFNANNLASAIYRAVQTIPDMPKNRSLHGLRYAAGSTMEEAGCSIAEIEAVLGHRTFRMALKYASQRIRAKAAIAKMEAAD